MNLSPTLPSSGPNTDADQRMRELLARHLHPEWGSTYWLQRQAQLGWQVCERVRTLDDLWLLGLTPTADLRRLPIHAFIPKALHKQRSRFIVAETAGTNGEPCGTAYRDDEFQAAFIDPFLCVAEAIGFPKGEPWLWVGPSGPHVIGKVVRELARQTGSMDPFSVDFDPRWAKRLTDGSMGRKRYLDHVVQQALCVLRREEIGVLFITPPALAALALQLDDRQREAIHGIHYGGMSLNPDSVNHFRAVFPNAVHLAGYGNTLFGVIMEIEDRHRAAMDYYPLGGRVQFHIVEELAADKGAAANWPPRICRQGETGRVLFHRLDESCLLVNVMERDQAERIVPSPSAHALGGHADGLRNPRPLPALQDQLQQGIY
jgi:thienamycin biosynthesis protein ThnN